MLYNVITRLRNQLYDLGIRPSVTFEIPVISVGNLTVGGTGKSPMIEYLIRLFSNNHKIATLSRGYGRDTKGIRIASKLDNSTTIGDEPLQFYRKYGDRVIVSVGEERALAIAHILHEAEDIQVILLDDAFQHRKVRPSFSILLSDYNRPFYKDYLIPAGRLREARSGAERADVLVVTKCPSEIREEEMMEIEKAIRKYATKPVFFATIHYGMTLPIGNRKSEIGKDIILMTGIADAAPLVRYVMKEFELKEHLQFRDHHIYTHQDIDKLEMMVMNNPGVSILTTEKDKVKLESPEFGPYIRRLPFFYLPIEVEFIKNGREFAELAVNSVRGVQ